MSSAVSRKGPTKKSLAAHLEYAARIVNSLPEELKQAAHEPYGARALVYSLVIDSDAAPRAAQLARLEGR